MSLKTWNPIKAMGIGEEDGYWKWLREWLKAGASWQRIKAVLTSPFMECFAGLIGGGMLIAVSIWLGQSANNLYYLLLLGLIPCLLIALHGEYRDRMR